MCVCARIWAGGRNGDCRKGKMEEEMRLGPLPSGTPRLTGFPKKSFPPRPQEPKPSRRGIVIKAIPKWLSIYSLSLT